MHEVAIFGAGRIGRIHAHNLAAMAGIKLKYVFDPIREPAQELANALGATVADPSTIFADKTVGSIVIASPATTHRDLILAAVKAGKPIFCEKPVDMNAASAAECAEATRSARIGCMTGFQRRFDPTFSSAKDRLDRGEIGNPEMLIVTSRDPGAPPVSYLKQSGGIFNDMLIHDFDIVRWILCSDGDEPEWIFADGSCIIDPAMEAIPDLGSVIVNIRTRRGRLAQINAQRRAAYGYDQRFEVLGSKGMLQCGNHRPSEVIQSDGHGIHTDLPENFFLQRYREAYRLELEHFFARLQDGKPFRTTIEDGVAAQKLAEAATQSWQTGQKVKL
ncbi:MAG: inositol 2-dehydrogenase [Candidatus Pacebacteria bacterium]|nr:inositol 2-dehydrogenase [Candidatus Paceibacterota bacterium]